MNNIIKYLNEALSGASRAYLKSERDYRKGKENWNAKNTSKIIRAIPKKSERAMYRISDRYSEHLGKRENRAADIRIKNLKKIK